jgi:hypothetical protein
MAAGVVLAARLCTCMDGDFVSDPQTFEWGTLQLKLTIHDGAITAAEALQMPSHRQRSVELSEMAKPILLKRSGAEPESQRRYRCIGDPDQCRLSKRHGQRPDQGQSGIKSADVQGVAFRAWRWA